MAAEHVGAGTKAVFPLREPRDLAVSSRFRFAAALRAIGVHVGVVVALEPNAARSIHDAHGHVCGDRALAFAFALAPTLTLTRAGGVAEAGG